MQSANDLRIIKKRELKRIVELDISGKRSTEELLLEWSNIADNLIEEALTIARGPVPFCVIALGKLGSQELNYSSDVDLLYIYEGDREAATKIATSLTRILNDVTEEGFIFRVDTDLKPEGKYGPLVNTIDALERYYESRGSEWERQALIRARAVAGDKKLGEEFINRIQPFVYRKSLDINALKKIRANKL